LQHGPCHRGDVEGEIDFFALAQSEFGDVDLQAVLLLTTGAIAEIRLFGFSGPA